MGERSHEVVEGLGILKSQKNGAFATIFRRFRPETMGESQTSGIENHKETAGLASKDRSS